MRKLRCRDNTKESQNGRKKHEHLESGNTQIPLKNFM